MAEQQKAFYEIEKPKKIIYTVAVKPQINAVRCTKPKCNGEDECGNSYVEEVYECGVCGQWFCIEHIDLRSDLCDKCAELPKGLQQEIITFREELNR